MAEPQRRIASQAERLSREAAILTTQINRDDSSREAVELALAQAKHVRKQSSALVRVLAAERDNRGGSL